MKVSAEMQGEPSAEAEPDSLEDLLVETGVSSLTASSKVTVQEAALQALGATGIDLSPLRRALLRDLAVQALKRGGFDVTFERVETREATRQSTGIDTRCSLRGSRRAAASTSARGTPVPGGCDARAALKVAPAPPFCYVNGLAWIERRGRTAGAGDDDPWSC